jgi:hypothetical protein
LITARRDFDDSVLKSSHGLIAISEQPSLI